MLSIVMGIALCDLLTIKEYHTLQLKLKYVMD